MEWWTFRSKICRRLRVKNATACLAYHQFHDVLYRSLCPLRGAEDWADALDKMCEADEENANVELEIIDVVETHVRLYAVPTTLFADIDDRQPVGGEIDLKQAPDLLHIYLTGEFPLKHIILPILTSRIY
jgi:hypothetical protein